MVISGSWFVGFTPFSPDFPRLSPDFPLIFDRITGCFFATEHTEGTEFWPAWVYFGRPFLDVNICGRPASVHWFAYGGKTFVEADQMSHICSKRRIRTEKHERIFKEHTDGKTVRSLLEGGARMIEIRGVFDRIDRIKLMQIK